MVGYDGLEVAPLGGLEVIPQEGLEVVDSWTESLNNFKKDPVSEKNSPGRKRRLGHSTRFWILIALSIALLISVVISAVVTVTASHKHRR